MHNIKPGCLNIEAESSGCEANKILKMNDVINSCILNCNTGGFTPGVSIPRDCKLAMIVLLHDFVCLCW